MRYYLIYCTFAWLFFISCKEDRSCEPGYIGVFSLDTSKLSGESKKLVSKFRWDTVKLISNRNGKYHFNSQDQNLKEAEGIWYTKSDDIEGTCFGYVKQKNLTTAFITFPFDVMITMGDTDRLDLHFIKIGGNK